MKYSTTDTEEPPPTPLPMEASSSVTQPTYQKIGDPVLLDKIDRLFACNVGEYIDLPQLVVVGDQSSGKSSVLEGLTRLPFPRDSGLCTKFATQITFRRSDNKSIKVSILPDPNNSPEYKDRVRNWSIPDIQELDAPTFATIMSEVHDVMGLSANRAQASGLRKAFSNDVLRLEIHGPDEAHLSIIDVPGIFRTTTAGVTTAADKELVRDIIETYMRNPRTVMLTVVPANVDLATQEILEMAKEVDPNYHRTIGVMTKPDLVDKGAEQKVVEFIEGKASNKTLDWSIVRNPGQRELNNSVTDRATAEKIFFSRTAPWNTLSIERRGIDSLRTRLEDVLTKHIHREFPKVKTEINKRLAACKSALASLGAERDSADKQAQYLLDLATQFQNISGLAIKADYGGNEDFDALTGLRLATEVVGRNTKFSDDMERFGHHYHFHEDDSVAGQNDGVEGSDGGESHPHSTRYVRNATELDEILPTEGDVDAPSSLDILEWLKQTYHKSQGFELGTFDPSLLTAAMRQQSSNWHALSLGYVSDAVALVHNFITELLQSLCSDERVRERLLNLLMDGLLEKYRKALAQVDSLLKVELSGVPMTVNHYFNDNLEKRRQQRLKSELTALSVECDNHGGEVIALKDIVQNHPMTNADHTIRDIHDILHAYYKVARKRFVDYCCMHAVSYHLIHGPDTPLKLFSSKLVWKLKVSELEDIAGEDSGLKRKRAQLRKEIGELEAGRKVVML